MAKVTGAVESFGAASLCGGRRFEPGQTLPLVAGTSLDLVVTGFGVDNADRVEAVSLPGVKVQLSGRRSFPVPQLTLALKIDAKAPVGKGELRLRYPVEVAGYGARRRRGLAVERSSALSIPSDMRVRARAAP